MLLNTEGAFWRSSFSKIQNGDKSQRSNVALPS